MFTPFALLDWPAAKLFWLCCNLVFIGLLLSGLQRSFPLQNPTVLGFVVLLFLCAAPLRTSIGAGQHNFISLAAFFWAYWFAQQPGRSSVAGVLLAIAWIKYSLTFPLTLLFIARGQWRPIIIASAVHTALTAFAGLRMGYWPHEFFFSSVEVVLMGDGVGFLNLVALTMKFKLPMIAALIPIAIASVYALYLLPRHAASDDLTLLTFLGLFSCAVFYHHGYDFIVLILAVWSIAHRSIKNTTALVCAALVALAWFGQWIAHEAAPVIGSPYARIADNLLIAFFYSALGLLWLRLHKKQTQTEHTKVEF